MKLDLSHLNPSQRAAVDHTFGPMLVLAGAGSGKTRVVTYRMGRLLLEGARPRSILAVTFTNKAAKEMRERLFALVGPERARGITISTFHSFCARVLRRDAHRIGVSTTFTILDQSDQLAQLMRVAKDIGVDGSEIPPRMVLSKIGWFKNHGWSPDTVPPSSDPVHLLAQRLYGPYTSHLRQLQAVDFDDLLLLTRDLLSQIHDVRKRYHQQFWQVLIDEYQDTNPIQFELVKLIVNPEHQNLSVVGDDDQAIYGFRGSAIENILEFDRIFTPCKVVKLEDNYRSTASILGAANAVIRHNQNRRDKTLRSALGAGESVKLVACEHGEAEAEYVAKELFEVLNKTREFTPDECAVLYRANPQSRLFEADLRAYGIPYRVVGGQEFFERRDVKNTLAYLSLIAHPDDELSFRRVVNLPARGLGEKAVQAVVDAARDENMSLLDMCVSESLPHALKAEQKETLKRFGFHLLGARNVLACDDENVDPVDVVSHAIHRAGLQQAIDRETDLGAREKMVGSIEEVLAAFASWCDRVLEARANPDLEESWLVDKDQPVLASFLDRIALDEEERQKERERNKENEKEKKTGRVTLMSLHASKGLEFPLVFLVGFEEGMLPHRRVLDEDPVAGVEEERRLCYVGITRAQRRLILTHAKTRRRRREMIPRKASRFAREIPTDAMTETTPFGDIPEDPDVAAADFFATMRAKLGDSTDAEGEAT